MIDLTVNGHPPGEIVKLPKARAVTVRAELSSPRDLLAFKLVRNGQELDSQIVKITRNGIHRWVIEQRIHIDQSAWIATWGRGESIAAQGDIDVMAHTNAIRIFVDDQPVRSQKDAEQFIQELAERREHYKENGVYKNDAQRQRALELLDQAIEKLRER